MNEEEIRRLRDALEESERDYYSRPLEDEEGRQMPRNEPIPPGVDPPPEIEFMPEEEDDAELYREALSDPTVPELDAAAQADRLRAREREEATTRGYNPDDPADMTRTDLGAPPAGLTSRGSVDQFLRPGTVKSGGDRKAGEYDYESPITPAAPEPAGPDEGLDATADTLLSDLNARGVYTPSVDMDLAAEEMWFDEQRQGEGAGDTGARDGEAQAPTADMEFALDPAGEYAGAASTAADTDEAAPPSNDFALDLPAADMEFRPDPWELIYAEDTRPPEMVSQGSDTGDMTGRDPNVPMDNSRWLSEPGEEQSPLDDLGREDIADDFAAYEAAETPAYEASESPAEEVAEGEMVYPLGEGFDDPDMTAGGEPAMPPPTGPDATEWDAMASGLEGRVFEDGSIGWPGDGEPPEGWPASGGAALADPRVAEAKVPDAGDPALRLDAGLPTEGEIGGATFLDAIRWPLHAIGNGLMAASGRSTTPFRSVAGEMRDARTGGINERLETKGESEERERGRAAELAETRERLASDERRDAAENEVDLMRERRYAAEGERDAAAEDRRLDIAELTARSRAETAEFERATAEERADPASEVSGRARDRLDLLMEGLPSRLREEVLDGRDLSTMSADDVVAIEENAQGWWRSWLARRIGGGGSGTSPGGGDGPDARAIQLEEAVRAGLAPDIEAAERLRMSLPENRGDGGFASMGRLILGSTNEANVGGVDAHEPIPNIRVTVPMSAPATRAFANDWRLAARGHAAIGTIERIVASHSRAERAVSPEMSGELAAALMTLRGIASNVQGSGVINPSEMDAINASIPDPTNPANLVGIPWSRFEASVREWRTRLLEDMRINLESVGADEDSIRYAERYMRRAGTADARSRASAPDSGGEANVRIRLPDGSIRPMSRADYDALRAAGHSPELVP